jgi:predicted lysophospholipase L1 biosynthesis ABC-type transport system permease subunit
MMFAPFSTCCRAMATASSYLFSLMSLANFGDPGALGVAIGLACARLGASVMRSLVFGVTVSDPITFALAGGAVFIVALVATFVPVLRIVRLNPIRALRQS